MTNITLLISSFHEIHYTIRIQEQPFANKPPPLEISLPEYKPPHADMYLINKKPSNDTPLPTPKNKYSIMSSDYKSPHKLPYYFHLVHE